MLRKAGHTIDDVARLTGVSAASVKRIAHEAPVDTLDGEGAEKRRGVGRPSKVEDFRPLVERLVAERDSAGAPLRPGEILRRARLDGYAGGKSALFALIARLRPKDVTPLVRFEGVPGEFSQHDFGQRRAVHRRHDRAGAVLRLAPEVLSLHAGGPGRRRRVESLVRSLVMHFEGFDGVPLVAVFDNPTTVVVRDKTRPEGRRFNATFAEVMLDLGVAVELCMGEPVSNGETRWSSECPGYR